MYGITHTTTFGNGENISKRQNNSTRNMVSLFVALCEAVPDIQFLGPILRIAPNEIHVEDPSFMDLLYTGSSKRRDKSNLHSRSTACLFYVW